VVEDCGDNDRPLPDTSAMIDGNGHADTMNDFSRVLPMRFNFQRFIEFILSI
jgi:hypothetical protein